MENQNKGNSPLWKTPQEVMKFHRAKRKLARRLCNPAPCSANNEDSLMEFPNPPAKRWTPFVANSRAEETPSEESGFETDASSHSSDNLTLDRKAPTTFKNLIGRLDNGYSSNASSPEKDVCVKNKTAGIPIDWSLKSKIRFMSVRPFPWSGTMRTGEEVSALTGFVRCLSPGCGRAGTPRNLDTSVNAQLHQCVQFWHHPHLPWQPNILSRNNRTSTGIAAAQREMADALHSEWIIAFRSLFQLVRTRQCPYFYVIGGQFSCVFRAAGMGGFGETHVLISNTTRGFRKILDDEEILFAMPLRRRKNSANTSENDMTIQDSALDEPDDDDVEEWMEAEQLKKLSVSRKSSDRRRETRLDGFDESTVVVSGVHLQGLFNLLVNMKDHVDKIPPTLISPTAFSLATLKSCRVRDSVVHVDGNRLYSIQIEGPIMPHALWDIIRLLKREGCSFSAAIATVRQTQIFTEATKASLTELKEPASIFLEEDLTDCGLSRETLTRLCESDVSKYGVIDGIEPEQLNSNMFLEIDGSS